MRSFNARYLSYEEVASDFVETTNYRKLLDSNHSLLTGPRGCGKTTMLKMLTPRGIKLLNKLEEVPFWGIYIPTDRQWRSQTDFVESLYHCDKTFSHTLSRAMVNINMAMSFCRLVEDLWEIADIEEGERTFHFCAGLVETWKLSRPIAPSINSILVKLRSYLSDVDIAANKGDGSLSLPDLCYINFVNIILCGIEVFESQFYNLPFFSNHKKWAICIDEMEIAPDWLIDDIRNSLRSIDQRLLFKITSAPSTNNAIQNVFSASVGNDYQIIKAWVYDTKTHEEWNKFYDSIIQSRIYELLNINEKTLLSLITSLDNAEFYENPPSRMNKLIASLRKIDKGLDRALIDLGVSVNDTEVYGVVKKNKIILDYYTLFQREKLIKQRKGLIKNQTELYQVYLSRWLLTDFCDGNPRVLVSWIEALVDIFKTSQEANGNIRMNVPGLTNLLISFSNHNIYNKLAYSVCNLKISDKNIGYKDLLDAIGEHMREILSGDSFVPQPEVYFYNESEMLNPFIDKALETGAIILIDDSSSYRGIRSGVPVYRLNEGLYPYYNIVRTNSKEVLSLMDIVSRKFISHEN